VLEDRRIEKAFVHVQWLADFRVMKAVLADFRVMKAVKELLKAFVMN
jgi:hypothetical protein